MIKKFFGKKDGDPQQQYTIDDLMVLERYAEAEQRINEELRFRANDLNLHLKLADVYVGLRNVAKAVDEYVWVAEKYAGDGFHDRGIAVLTKARKLNPMDDSLPPKMERMENSRKLEHSRVAALDGFVQGLHAKEGGGTAVMEFQTFWRQLIRSRLLRELTSDQLKLFFQGVIGVYLNAGQTVMERGSREEALFIVASGDIVATVADPAGASIEVRMIGPGQIFGEGSIFEHRPWPASYKAKSKATVLKLSPEGLQLCLTGNPDPRGFLDVLRREQNDRDVVQLVQRLEAHA